MKRALVSIIIPVYNVERYVGKCLDSVTNQSYDDIEIIVVNDGSTDGSGEICDQYAKKDQRIKVFHKKNGGLSDARNYGIEKSKGEIIAFVDSDDFVKKDFVGAMYQKMIQENADIVECGYNSIKPKRGSASGDDATIRLLIEQETVDIVTWNKLYKKSLFVDNDVWFPKGKKHEDILTTYKILSKAKKVVYLDKILYCYVDRKESITNTEKTEERLEMRELAAREAIEYFEDNVKLKQAAEVSLLLAKYAYLDFAIGGKIEKKYGELARKWIKKHEKKYNKNSFLTRKLKVYNVMNGKLGGISYWVFRKIVHE